MSTTDHNALLLQVMAHDLLAPLTAIKWQLEILAKEGVGSSKSLERLSGAQKSTQLGITLTKHAHVAGRVLVGSYERDVTTTALADIVRDAALDLRAQYERHGLTLEVSVDPDTSEYAVDVNLLSLLVWSISKYFLACAPANTTVSFRGMTAPNANGGNLFVLIGSADNIPETEKCARSFVAAEAVGAYDQLFVFATLIHKVGPLVGASVSASVQGQQLIVEATFDRV